MSGPLTPSPASRQGGLKRKAEADGPAEDSPLHPTRRSLIKAQIEVRSLEAKLLKLESLSRNKDETLEAQRVQIERLQQDRRSLNGLHDAAIAEVDKAKREAESAKEEQRKHASKVNAALKGTEDRLQSLDTEYNNLSFAHRKHVQQATQEKDLLQNRLQKLEEERSSLQTYRDQAHALNEANTDLSRQLIEAREALSSQRASSSTSTYNPLSNSTGPVSADAETLRKELRRQGQHLASLERTNATLLSEVKELRARRDNVEMLKGEIKEIERKAGNKVRVLEAELDRTRTDLDLTATHSQCGTEISRWRLQAEDLMDKLTQVSNESLISGAELRKRADEAERELRWMTEAKVNAERKLGLARKELDVMRSQPSTSTTPNIGDQGGRIAQLEEHLNAYRQAIESFEVDRSNNQANVILELDLVKRTDLDEAVEAANKLRQQITETETALKQVQKDNEELLAEVKELMDRVGSGEYNTKVWRVVELGGGPAQKDLAIRTEKLNSLQQENQALLEQIVELETAAGGAGGQDGGHVPKETVKRHQQEMEEIQAAADKRLRRLKEVFGSKSREFLEGVYSLLGWRFKWAENGEDVKLQCMYAPKGKMGLTIKFKPQNNHYGTMVMTGGMAKQFTQLRRFWVEERQSIPCFLASVTMEMFEKTTIGRVAGYLAFEEQDEAQNDE